MSRIEQSELVYLALAKKFICNESLFIDIGANTGGWSERALEFFPKSRFILFEPLSEMASLASQRLAQHCNIIIEHNAVSSHNGPTIFTAYSEKQTFSTLFRRDEATEKANGLIGSEVTVECIRLDSYLEINAISRVGFLKIEAEGAEMSILEGSKKKLVAHDIDFIQIEYGGTWRDARRSIAELKELLSECNYQAFIEESGQIKPLPPQFFAQDHFHYCNILAVSPRIASGLTGIYEPLYTLEEVTSLQHSDHRGVVHVGAHKGSEIKSTWPWATALSS